MKNRYFYKDSYVFELTPADDVSKVGLHALVCNCAIAHGRDLPVQLVQRLLVRHQHGPWRGAFVVAVLVPRRRPGSRPPPSVKMDKQNHYINYEISMLLA